VSDPFLFPAPPAHNMPKPPDREARARKRRKITADVAAAAAARAAVLRMNSAWMLKRMNIFAGLLKCVDLRATEGLVVLD
jgi:hypothetical protein